jgi:aldehyde dehydrogenase (NAD+)
LFSFILCLLTVFSVFYTGNGRVARIIAAAAAKHLTPLTLELGGKSPVIVDGTFDLNLAAKRILHGKLTNAGQVASCSASSFRCEHLFGLRICVCPDYVLVPREKQDELIACLTQHLKAFFPEGALSSQSFGRIVSDLHFNRLMGLLKRTKGEIVFGGGTDQRRGIEPTIVKNVMEDDSLLEEYDSSFLGTKSRP